MTARNFTTRLLGASMVALILLLSGCYGKVRHAGNTVVNLPAQYDMTLEAAKDGQFLLDGALLSAEDLSGHFRYLADQKQLPKTVLLKDGKDSDIKDAHLQNLATLQLNYHFTAYVDQGGDLTLMNSVEDKHDKSDRGDQGDQDDHGGGRHMGHRH